MTNDQYFQSISDYVWQWEDNGAVVAIPGGTTIAYRQLLVDLLNQLAPQGLPPFGSLLMALAATNLSGKQDVRLINELIIRALPSLSAQGFMQQEIDQAIALLHQLTTVPDQHRQGRKRLLLLQTLFDGAHNGLSPVRSKAVLNDLINPESAAGSDFLQPQPFAKSVLFRDLKTLTIASRRYPTVAALMEAVAAVPDLPDADLLLTPPMTPEALVEALLANEKTVHVGALLKPLWAGLAMPLHRAQPSQQPLGGVSDLTNKGAYDRLLLTEFAQDDLLFLSRLANNEALFLNRELPPAANDAERIFLLDVSLKTWGTPRTLAFALLLALAKHPKTDIGSRAYVVGKRAVPIAFATVEELIDSLLHLDGSLHPADGLTQFMTQQYDRRATPELVLITTPDNLQTPALQRWLADYQTDLTYLMTTQPDGAIVVYKQQKKARKHLQTLILPIDKLWQAQVGKAKKERINEDDPADDALSRGTYPILFPYSGGGQLLSTAHETVLYYITAGRSLLRRQLNKEFVSRPDIARKGWTLLYENLPTKGKFCEIGALSNGKHVLLQFDPSKKIIYLLTIETGDQLSIDFLDWKQSGYERFVFSNDYFFWKTTSVYWIIDPRSAAISRYDQDPLTDLHDWHLNRKKTLDELLLKVPQVNVLKNVNSIFINVQNNLVINQHELRLNTGGVFKLDVTSFLKAKVVAEPNRGKTLFTFPDGSTVQVNRNGMLILTSTDLNSFPFYVPLVLDGALGMCVKGFFSGNKYYQPEGMETSDLESPPTNFWHRFVAPFVQTILNHAVTD
ncbi:hypothetical protein [Fibrella aquatilis]|uniref:Uncharacterized protein n=1 Tax=Fibrella aquatilis TaxID=2817059 RepID=A0A939JZV2_9BACT|nr:hypothetical protein [Fibrella aquatilis]MBO0931808.1 hypothetical protein [Fibrella aquatilis]